MDFLFAFIIFSIFVGIFEVLSPETSWKVERVQNKLLGIGPTERPKTWELTCMIRGSLLSVLAIVALYGYYHRF
jgi:hypothetical protein